MSGNSSIRTGKLNESDNGNILTVFDIIKLFNADDELDEGRVRGSEVVVEGSDRVGVGSSLMCTSG